MNVVFFPHDTHFMVYHSDNVTKTNNSGQYIANPLIWVGWVQFPWCQGFQRIFVF